MSGVAEILAEKGSTVHAIAVDATVYEAIERMVASDVGALLVTAAGGGIAGIVTERDYLRRVALEGRTSRETRVEEIMTTPLVCVTPETSVEECMALMTDRRIRHLPVVEDDRLVGLVSIGDLVKFQSRRQSFELKYLTEYIAAR